MRVGIQRSRLISARRQSGFQCSQLSDKKKKKSGHGAPPPQVCYLLTDQVVQPADAHTHTRRAAKNKTFQQVTFWRPTLISLSRSSLVRMKEEPPAGARRAPWPHLPRGLSAPTTQSPATMTAAETNRSQLSPPNDWPLHLSSPIFPTKKKVPKWIGS